MNNREQAREETVRRLKAAIEKLPDSTVKPVRLSLGKALAELRQRQEMLRLAGDTPPPTTPAIEEIQSETRARLNQALNRLSRG